MELQSCLVEIDFQPMELQSCLMEINFHPVEMAVHLMELHSCSMAQPPQLKEQATGQTNVAVRARAIVNKPTVAATLQRHTAQRYKANLCKEAALKTSTAKHCGADCPHDRCTSHNIRLYVIYNIK
jgi:hypothetical protein